MTRRDFEPKLPCHLPVCDLRVGDVVKWFDGPFGTAIVEQVTADEVKLFRPYGTTSGFTYSGNKTICYHGSESGTYSSSSKEQFLVYQRGEMK